MSIYTKRSGVTNHPESTILQEFTDLVAKGGVFKLSSDFKVSEKAGGADLSVDVAKGSIYLKRDASCYPAYSDAIENVTISSNTSGNPRIDAVVIYADLVTAPSSTGQGADVVKFKVVEGTPAASPNKPTTSDIEATLGSSDPYEVLAYVTIADGATAITNADIEDARVPAYLRLPKKIVTGSGISYTPDLSLSDDHIVTATGDITINNPTNAQIGDTFTLTIVQDATGGRSVTFNFTDLSWRSADTSIATGANQRTIFGFKQYESGKWEGYLVGKDY